MTQRILVIGAGGHAKVVIEALRAAGFDPAGLIDPHPTSRELLGVPLLGDDIALPRLRSDFPAAAIALGSNRARECIAETLRQLGYALPPIIHPAAYLSPSATIGPGAVVMARATIGTLARIGALAILNTGCIVEHDNDIGACAHIAPGATLAGAVTVGPRALVGAGAVARPGVTIGADAIVGAGAAIVSDVPAGATWAGTPARPLRRA